MDALNVGRRPTATIEGVVIRLSRPEWLIITNMIKRRAAIERAPHVCVLLDRLARMKMISPVHVEGAAAQVYQCTPLARAFYKAVTQRAVARAESRARLAARRLGEKEMADE